MEGQLDIFDYLYVEEKEGPVLSKKTNNYTVAVMKYKEAREYIKANHYSKGCHNGASPNFGLYDQGKLIGCLMFATPCSENVRASVFGVDYKNHVTELHRLHILDCTPKNTESWFIAEVFRILKKIKPQIWAVISFADSTEGHEGTIYKATNAYRLGITGTESRFFIDETGRLRHPRQCGVNITKEKVEKNGWKFMKRGAKNRFLWILPDDKRHKRELLKLAEGYLRKHGHYNKLDACVHK